MSHRWGANRPPTISAAQRKRILQRDKRTCYVCHKPGANQVDHITPRHQGGTDTDGNLAAIHERPCHLNKTLHEAQAARQRPPRKRNPPPHPGVLPPCPT